MDTNVKAVELRELWRRYKQQGDERARERLVLDSKTKNPKRGPRRVNAAKRCRNPPAMVHWFGAW